MAGFYEDLKRVCADATSDTNENLIARNDVGNHETEVLSINGDCTDYRDYTDYAPTNGCLPNGKIRSYGAINSTHMLSDSDQDLDSGRIPNVAINGDVAIEEHEELTDRRPLILVSLMVMLVICANRINSIVIEQYLYRNFAVSIFGNVTIDTTSQPCASSSGMLSNSSSQLTDKLHQVQKEASSMSLNLGLTSYGIAIITNMILGTFSSTMSRKLLLLIPTTGYLLRCLEVPVVVYWDLDVTWLYLGYAIDGICGNICGILLGTFLYASDVTPRNAKRTLGITIVETIKGAVGAAFFIVSGQLIEKTGFLIPSLAAAGIQLLAVFVICALPDRRPVLSEKQREQVKSLNGAILYMFSPLYAPKDRRIKWMIRLATASFFVTVVARVGLDKVQTLYVMDTPFCFDAITIGWFLFSRDLIQHMFVIFTVVFLFRRLPGMLLAIAGALCMIACCCMYAFAQSKWEIVYIVTGLGLAQNLPFSVIRGQASRLLGSYYQGPLFASLAVVESFSYAAGVPFFLSVYKATLDFFSGFVFLAGAGLMLVSLLIMCVFEVLWVRYVRGIEYKLLTVPPPTQSDDS